MQGPDTTTSLMGVPPRLQKNPTALIAHIGEMFVQARVPLREREDLGSCGGKVMNWIAIWLNIWWNTIWRDTISTFCKLYSKWNRNWPRVPVKRTLPEWRESIFTWMTALCRCQHFQTRRLQCRSVLHWQMWVSHCVIVCNFEDVIEVLPESEWVRSVLGINHSWPGL